MCKQNERLDQCRYGEDISRIHFQNADYLYLYKRIYTFDSKTNCKKLGELKVWYNRDERRTTRIEQISTKKAVQVLIKLYLIKQNSSKLKTVEHDKALLNICNNKFHLAASAIITRGMKNTAFVVHTLFLFNSQLLLL